MQVLVWSTVAVGLIGAIHAVGQGRKARFAGIQLGGTAAQQALTIGSPLSAPPLMLVAFVVSAYQGRIDVVRILSTVFIVGILGEVDTWTTLRRPGSDPLSAVCVLADLALPIAVIWSTL